MIKCVTEFIEKSQSILKPAVFQLTCPPDWIQLGTLSLTIVISFDDDDGDKSSLSVFVEFDDKIGLSFEFVFVGIFTFNDDNDEHFCLLFICFKSWSTIFNSFDKDSIALREEKKIISKKIQKIFFLPHFVHDEHE